MAVPPGFGGAPEMERESLKPLYPGMAVPPSFGGPPPPRPKLTSAYLKANFPSSRASPPPDTLSMDSGYSFDTPVTSLDGEGEVDADNEVDVKHGVSGVENHAEDVDEDGDFIILAPNQPAKRIKFGNADAQAT